MPITLISGPANAGKAELALERVRAHAARGEHPLLVVPTPADSLQYTRELAAAGLVMGAGVMLFAELLETVCRRAGVTGAPLPEIARRRLLARLAVRHGVVPDGLAPTAGLEAALGELVEELQARRVTPSRLGAALARWESEGGMPAPLSGLARMYGEYHRECRARLLAAGCEDPTARAVLALDRLREQPALWGGTAVVIYGFDDLGPLQLDLVETLGARVDAPLTITLSYEPGRIAFAGRAATFAALQPLAAEHVCVPARAEHYAACSRAALAHLERSLFEADAAARDPGAAVRLLEAPGERSEVELVAREIRELIAAGLPAGEIAVLVRPAGLAPELVAEVFSAASIPFAQRRTLRLSDSAVGAALIGALRCAADAAAAEPSALLAWLRAPGHLRRPEFADELERHVRRAGIADAAAARAWWEQRHWKLDRIDELASAQPRGGRALLERAARELSALFNATWRRQARVLEGAEAEEARAYAAATSALDDLARLEAIDAALLPADAGELAEALARVELVAGDPPSAGAVAVLDPLALRARRVRALFVCGLQEGAFPVRARPGGLLSEEDRAGLAQASGLLLGERTDLLAAERYLLYAAVSRPEQLLFLSWHSADDEGNAVPRSLFVDDVCDLFDERLAEQTVRPRPAPAVAAAADHVGRCALRHPQVLAEVRQRPWSASSLESWIGCPVKWFVEKLLRPADLDPDAEPLARGSLAHLALKETLEGVRERTGTAHVRPDTLALALELLGEALERGQRERPLSLAPERLPGARRRLRRDLERYLERCAESADRLEPHAFEVPFGFPEEEDGLAPLELGGGAVVRGRIDRIDVGPAGEAVLIDYKSSKARAPDKWVSSGAVQVGVYMAAVEQLLGRTVVGGFYQPLAGDLRARGVLEQGSGLELEAVRGDEREPEAVRELLGEILGRAREATVQARAGQLEARPRSCAYEGGCKYPSICRCDR